MPIEDAIAGGIKGLGEIGFGIYDRYKQGEKEKEDRRRVERAIKQTESNYDQMLKLLEGWREGQVDLASTQAVAKYGGILEGYDPNAYTYDFDKFAFVDEEGKPITREDYIAKNRDDIIEGVTGALQHTAAGAGLGRGTGAALGIAEGVAKKDEELMKLAGEQFAQDRSQAYSEWSDYINKMQAKLDKESAGTMQYADLLGGAISQDKAASSDYMADLLSLLENKNTAINTANLALLG